MTKGLKKFTYSSPVDQLLSLGDVRESTKVWPDYLSFGFTEAHVSELIRLALDADIYLADLDKPEAWANMHAWRTLGQLQAQAAIEPLLNLLWHVDEDDNDWIGEELPEVYCLIGPAAVPALSRYIVDSSHGVFARIAAADSGEEIGKKYPQHRHLCIACLGEALENFAQNDLTLNAFLISPLVDWRVKDLAPLMEQAFRAGCVDEWVRGDWEDVQIDLGLKTKRDYPRKLHPLYQELMETNLIEGNR